MTRVPIYYPEHHPILQAMDHLGDKFDSLVAHYMFNGYVYFGSDAIIMAKPMNKADLMEEHNGECGRIIENVLDNDDTWYVQYAAGNIKRFFEVCPFDLEWVVFERWGNDRLRAYKFDKLKRYSNGRT